jgi:hypothetical protein
MSPTPNQFHPSPRCQCADCRRQFPPQGAKAVTPQERFEGAFSEVFGTRTLPDFTPQQHQNPGPKRRG